LSTRAVRGLVAALTAGVVITAEAPD